MQTQTELSNRKRSDNRAHFLTLLLSFILFWTGLGVGENLSDSAFWIASTWTTIQLEWIFIIAVLVLLRPSLSLGRVPKKYHFMAIILFLWFLIVLLSYSASPFYGWQNKLAQMRLLETFSHVLFFGSLWYFFSHFKIDYHPIFIAAIIPLLIVLCYFVYIHFAFPDLKADRHVFSMRSPDLLLNTHLHRIGYQAEAAIAFCLAFLFIKRFQTLALGAIGLLLLFMFWLGGRASLFGILVALTLFFVLYRDIFSRRFFAVIVLSLMPIAILSNYFDLLDLHYIRHAMHKTFDSDSLDTLLTGRISLWTLAFSNLDGYWLLGTGPQSYIFYPGRANDVIHAHNFILQFLTEWGIAGTLSFGLLMILALRRGFILRANEPDIDANHHIAAGFLILALTITALFGGIYFFAQTSLYLSFAFALWITPSSP